MRSRVTQEDIAKELGLSTNTVSLALKDSKRIHEDTRAKIQQVAKKLNYIPNSIARSLVQKKTNIIGFVLPKITNTIHIEAAQQIERKLLAYGYNMILMTTDSDKNYEAQALDILLSRQVDGIFLYPTNKENQEKLKSIRDANCPIVLLSGGELELSSDSVYMNQQVGAYKLTTHLAELGHRQIAFMYGGALNAEKFKGYRKALDENNVEFKQEFVIPVQNLGYEQGYYGASVLLERGPVTAIIGTSDYLALGALRWCRAQGLRVPEDIAIVGFDDLEAARYAEVALTTVTYQVDKLTTQAIDLLLRLISSKKKLSLKKPVRIEIEPALVIRESCGGIK